MKFEPGSKIGDYEVLGQIGAGGMGRVYKVRNELSDRVEAMKVLLPDLEGHADLANRFLREIKVQANLDHPNIAKLYTALRIDNQLLMCMEMVDGVTLDEHLRQHPVALVDAIDYIIQVLSALEYAHQRGIVHRDIKPANMMLMAGGRIKLLDFGIAKAADNRLTVTGTTLGSLYYMSPEQIQGAVVDARSDLYSVGISLYELVTGKKPFDAESQFAIMSAHLARTPEPPVEMNPKLPAAVNDTILYALNKDPATRFQSAGEFLEALRAVQEEVGYGTVTAPAPPPRTNLRMTSLPIPPAATQPSFPADMPPLGDSLRLTALQRSATDPPAVPAEPVQPELSEEPKGGSKRTLWIAVGAVCAVAAIVAFIQFGSKGNSSKEAGPTPFTVSAPVPGTPKPSPSPATNSGKDAVRKPAVAEHAQTPAPQQATPAPPPAVPAQQAAPSAPSQPEPAQVNGALVGSANKDRVEMGRLSERFDVVYGRAKAIREKLQNQPNAKNELVESFNRLNQYLKQASSAMNNSDPPTVASLLLKAENELDGLESALGK
jgi:eukaryotic-like serine/threonine-protein kinase